MIPHANAFTGADIGTVVVCCESTEVTWYPSREVGLHVGSTAIEGGMDGPVMSNLRLMLANNYLSPRSITKTLTLHRDSTPDSVVGEVAT